jgi:mRNA interferase MazF
MITLIYKGEVYLINLSSNDTMEEKSVRPCLVVQNDIGNRFSPTIIVAALTSRIRESILPTHVHLDKDKYGFDLDQIVLMEQIRTISKSRLVKKITSLDNSDMEKVDAAWCISGGVNFETNKKMEKEISEYYEFYVNEEITFLEENYECEFKCPRDTNNSEEIISLVKDKVIEYVVSFLNGNGGRIFFGVDNDKIVKGIRLSYEERDELTQIINSKINDCVKPRISLDYYKINWHEIKSRNNDPHTDLYVLEIEVIKPFNPMAIYFDRGKVLYIKTSSGRQKYTEPYEMVSSIIKRVMDNKNIIESILESESKK